MSLAHDFRYAARALAKTPVFTATAVVSLALGIGAATAIFSLANAILLRSLTVPNPHDLRVIRWTGGDWEKWEDKMGANTGTDRANRFLGDSVTLRMWRDMREHCADQAEVFGYSRALACAIRARREASSTRGMVVTGNFFSGLKVQPLLGTLLNPEDDQGVRGPVAVISHGLWDREFGLDPNIAGQSLTIRASTFTIAGVLPREFAGVEPGSGVDFYVPVSALSLISRNPLFDRPDIWWIRPMARLKTGADTASFFSRVNTIFMREAQAIRMREPKLEISSGHAGPGDFANNYTPLLHLLLLIVGIVLVVASLNLAGLMIARGAARRHEFAVRAALGANNWRLFRQSLIESVLISISGGTFGLFLAVWVKSLLGSMLADSPEGLRYDTSLDLRVLGFTAALCVATALLSGMLPAMRAARTDPTEGLKDRAVNSAPRLQVARFLVTAQIALSLMLACVSALYVRGFINLSRVPTGYKIDHLLVFELWPFDIGYEKEKAAVYYERVLESLQAIPGVQFASLSWPPPLSSGNQNRYMIRGADSKGLQQTTWTIGVSVSDSYFATLGIPTVRGRALLSSDDAGALKVAVVNELFVNQFLRGRNPIGVIIQDPQALSWEIVGVCRDLRYSKNVTFDAKPMAFFPMKQRPVAVAGGVLRTTSNPIALAKSVRAAVIAVDPKIPIVHLRTMKQARHVAIGDHRTFALLGSSLAALAVALSCIGLFGLMAYQVSRRTGEIGIRMALGATRRNIGSSILQEALLLTAIGIVIGSPLAISLSTAFYRGNSFYGLDLVDPITYCGAPLLFVLVTFAAVWFPVHRAVNINPMVALRTD